MFILILIDFKICKKLSVYSKKDGIKKLICDENQNEVTLKTNQKIDIDWD